MRAARRHDQRNASTPSFEFVDLGTCSSSCVHILSACGLLLVSLPLDTYGLVEVKFKRSVRLHRAQFIGDQMFDLSSLSTTHLKTLNCASACACQHCTQTRCVVLVCLLVVDCSPRGCLVQDIRDKRSSTTSKLHRCGASDIHWLEMQPCTFAGEHLGAVKRSILGRDAGGWSVGSDELTKEQRHMTREFWSRCTYQTRTYVNMVQSGHPG